MFHFILGLIGLGGVSFLASATRHHGWMWSDQFCRQGGILCDHPSWILIIAGAFIAWEMLRTMSSRS